ncbi:TetR/AcrR family transcriptional regulator [Hydrogenimonas thermophila]|uniref:TetR/AcrR family transcriptional regulator n=1 Tax=Hydrogenimonas thermophila TaxID=223786 RepID=UPI00293749CA|nr:TetR/AcrR family transcriptional regulator [Hydrogenimonas thermophila]WOE70242.1 TetR/AcrR family transcriptional regulator [Hydrogenimonas thermophila]WOE72759.1 TetR/AcrR family transcriptional regulator [Hydrogenimonas thermophila]
MKKSKYHHGNLKDELLNIAFEFIHKNGVENLTLKILAEETGTSRSAIYRHFSSKDELIETIIEKGFEEFDNAVSPILKDIEKPLADRFYLSGKKYIEFAIDNRNLYTLLFGKKYADIRERIVDIKDDDCSGFGTLKLAIEEGQKSGIVKNDDSYKQAIVIWSSLHGLASLIINGFMNVEEIYEEIYNDMFKTLLAGIVTNRVKLISSIPFLNRALEPKL